MHVKIKCCLLFLFCCSSLTFGQSTDSSSVAHKFEIGVSLFYYQPNLDEFNNGFSKLEQNLGLTPSWSNFKISYLVLPTIIYHVNRRNQMALQVGGSFLEQRNDDLTSYYFIWMIGGEYRYIPLSFSIMHLPSNLSMSLGAGMIGAKFHRAYKGNVAVNEFTSTFYVQGGTALSVDLTRRIGIHVDVRYMFVPKKKFETVNSDLLLKSVMAGVGIFYSF
jgi:hypothetical protein